MTAKKTHNARETWLQEAIALIAPMFAEVGANNLPNIRVACGWAKRAGKGVGWCWHTEVSGDGVNEIQISPERDDTVEVLAILAHEMIHASDNGKSKHSGYFRRIAVALGLEGKMTATIAGDALRAKLQVVADKLGPYPHAAMNPSARTTGKQGTRMIKVMCPEDGYTVRTTAKWIEVGLPTCACGIEMEVA